MKIWRTCSVVGATATLWVSAALCHLAQAEPTPKPPTKLADNTVTITRLIEVKNVAPNVLAGWLAPVKNHNTSEYPESLFRGSGSEVSQLTWALPLGIQSVTPVMSRNALSVTGTEAGIRELQEIVAFLDHRITQVELEVQFIEINAKELRTLLPPDAVGPTNAEKTALLSDNYREVLSDLVTKKKVKIVSTPKVIAANNHEVKVIILDQLLTVRFADVKFLHSDIKIHVSTQLTVVPTMTNGLIQVSLSDLLMRSDTIGQSSRKMLVTSKMNGLPMLSTLRDGGTMVGILGESPSSDSGKMPSPMTILLVTARVVPPNVESKSKPALQVH